VGLRRGRRHPDEVRVGDALDFWRVETVEPNELLRLRAEMKVPGLAWLEFEAKPQTEAQTLLSQTAFFAPKGLFGQLYWYLLYPIHRLIFSGIIRQLARRAEAVQQGVDFFPSDTPATQRKLAGLALAAALALLLITVIWLWQRDESNGINE
jgi:hypothetical protein